MATSDFSFITVPERIDDWRKLLLYEAASEAGVLASLPAAAAEVADLLGLDGHATRVVLDALAVWQVVEARDGRYQLGPGAPAEGEAAVFRHHARSIQRWSVELHDRLHGRPREDQRGRRMQLDLWLDALATNARTLAGPVADACLDHFPSAHRLLDLGGGHGEYALEFARRGLDVTMQDRPEVVEIAQRRGRLGAAGVQLFAGDLFETFPDRRFDVVLCAGLTHTYGQEPNQDLFQRVRAITSADGGVAIVTFLRDHDPMVAVFAVQMLLAASGADTHAVEDYDHWLDQAGFSSPEVIDIGERPQALLLAASRPR
ncbi:MAG: class I SAM-dependent methyltransferase [Actinomycetota bacterium]|nr:class I SAM-dependent methyltransferase [Actinomycetota bacterium]MDQ3574443.1 class I SAM-dependent methyltransferase [Actinomycetota bacterium]